MRKRGGSLACDRRRADGLADQTTRLSAVDNYLSSVAFVSREIVLPRPDWSRPLPRPLTIPDVLTLETLADVRVLVEKHLPAEYRSKFTWRQFAGLLKRAAEGQQDVAEVATALRIVLQLEGV
jgi:hypothetical protein